MEATIDNQSAAPIRLVEVDYPSASFGASAVAAGSQFHYRFKIQGSAPVKLQFTDESGKQHEFTGPELDQGQEGRLTIKVDEIDKVSWHLDLASR